jgi:aconitate hydratase
VTATDLVLTVTEMLRKEKVVGKFVEFFGEGTASLAAGARPRDDRQHGARVRRDHGLLPGRRQDDRVLRITGRTRARSSAFEAYFKAQGLFGMPKAGEIDYSEVSSSTWHRRARRWPARSARRTASRSARSRRRFTELFSQAGRPRTATASRPPSSPRASRPAWPGIDGVGHGDVLIAAITSCTNTSTPGVLLAAGLLAKKAVERGLKVKPARQDLARAGLARRHRVPENAGLLPYLEQLGFYVAATAAPPASATPARWIRDQREAIVKNDLVCAAVLSGNRNFEARIHPNLRRTSSQPAAGGRLRDRRHVNIDLMTEPLGRARTASRCTSATSGRPDEIARVMKYATDAEDLPQAVQRPWPKATRPVERNPAVRNRRRSTTGRSRPTSPSRRSSTASACSPGTVDDVKRRARARHLRRLDHHRPHLPAGAIKDTSPAGKYLIEHGVGKADFNSYGARRGNHEVMMRGTFANVRIKNLMLPPKADGSRVEGG